MSLPSPPQLPVETSLSFCQRGRLIVPVFPELFRVLKYCVVEEVCSRPPEQLWQSVISLLDEMNDHQNTLSYVLINPPPDTMLELNDIV